MIVKQLILITKGQWVLLEKDSRENAMKYVKSISLFILYPLLTLGIGFYVGVKSSHFFYPGELRQEGAQEPLASPEADETESSVPDFGQEAASHPQESEGSSGDIEDLAEVPEEEDAAEVLSLNETLCVDTEYVLEETDVLYHTAVETKWRLPEKYVGMDREQFLQAMEVYEAFPPLSELERGFVGLEVLSFSRERVVVRMDYKFVQPSSSFYLAVYDNEVVVYLEDMQTVYIETDIMLDSLPEDVQQSIIEMMWIKDEEALYSFLENYSS